MQSDERALRETVGRATFGLNKIPMSRIEIKQASVAKQVLETFDSEVLDQVKAVLDKGKDDWWEKLPKPVRAAIEKSLAEADRGETVSHAEAMKQVAAWRKR